MTLIKIAATKKTNSNEIWQDCGEKGPFTHYAHQPIDNENAIHICIHTWWDVTRIHREKSSVICNYMDKHATWTNMLHGQLC